MRLLSLTDLSVQNFIVRMRTTTLPLWVLAVATVVIVVACDRVNLTAPTGSTVSLSVERSVLPLGGQTSVTAVVTESAGTPVNNGTVVTFQTTVGSLSPVEAKTVNGVATTTFLAGTTSGLATITAFSGGARSTNSSSGGNTIKVGAAAAAGTISMSATPSSVSQSGGSVTITALVFDDQQNPLPGVNVQFSTATGTVNPSTATTDTAGTARTLLTTTQTSVVTAFAGAAKGDIRVEASAPPSVTISDPSPPSPAANTPVGFTVTATSGNASSARQIQTLDVNFGDNTSEVRTGVTGPAAFTHTYRNAGAYTITARAVDVAGNTGIAQKAIVVGHPPLPTISTFTANPNPVPPASNGLTSITVTAAPSSAGVPIRSVVVRRSDGTVIFSSTSGGTFAHQFPAASGAQTITATVTDANGETATSTTVVVVQ
jgi:hypothetical protein